MNERIRELMLEVGFVGYGEDLGSYNIPVPAFNSRMEKFAELIVKECIKLCDQVDLVGADDCMDKIRDYFEVEE